jgi:cytosine deaminase
MDPWYSYGTHDMLDVAHMGAHVAQMTGLTQMAQAYLAVTENGARALGLDDYGLAVGKPADLVILQATSVVEALQLRPARLYVIRAGEVIAKTPAPVTQVILADGAAEVSFCRQLF